MSFVTAFKHYLKQENLWQQPHHWLLPVSGGIDSVILVELCKQAKISFEILHCNFQLRAEESERDEAFVKQLAKQYQVVVTVQHFDTQKIANERGKGIQETARILRYEWFEQIRAERFLALGRSCYIVTAHHADDNAETICMNFFKGTGIQGIKGILPKHQHIVRPLLFARKTELIEFMKQQTLQFVEDSSNLTDHYTRNFFRHKVLPLVEEVIPKANENVINNAVRFREIAQLYEQAVQWQLKKVILLKGNEVHIPVLKLLQLKPLNSLVWEIIKNYGFSHDQIEAVVSLAKSETGKYLQSATHRILKNRKWLIIGVIAAKDNQHWLIEAPEQLSLQFTVGALQYKVLDLIQWKLDKSATVANIDLTQVHFPLILRRWKTGDYFYPLGMQKKKKISRFLIDQKLSLAEKEQVWVLESAQKIILWVVGHRIDDRCKVIASTKNVLQIRFTANKDV
jgi:tRNA(Ile)-lysidine synthase